jgi:hypothetical protein
MFGGAWARTPRSAGSLIANGLTLLGGRGSGCVQHSGPNFSKLSVRSLVVNGGINSPYMLYCRRGHNSVSRGCAKRNPHMRGETGKLRAFRWKPYPHSSRSGLWIDDWGGAIAAPKIR